MLEPAASLSFRALVENAQDAIARIDYAPTKRFTFVNRAQCALTGYTAEEFYADPEIATRIVHPADREGILKMRMGQEEPVLMRVVRKDGSVRWCESRFNAVRDEQGRVVAVESFNRDVTSRVEAEERFRSAVAASLDAFGVYRAVRDPEGRIVDFLVEFVNEAACRLSGKTPEEMVGGLMTELHPGAAGSPMMKEYVHCVEARTPLALDDVRGPSGRWFDVRAAPVADGFTASWREVGERRRRRVARGVVRRYLRHARTEGAPGAARNRDMGRGLAREVDVAEGVDLQAFLDAFGGMGLGELVLDSQREGRWVFRGSDLLDAEPRAAAPTCMITLGFLEGAISRLTGAEALGAETSCQSLGHEKCVFVVARR